MYYFLIFIPSFISLILCPVLHSIWPAIIIGGICMAIGIASIAFAKGGNGTSGTLPVIFCIFLPGIINGILNLLAAGIYYLVVLI
jgi:hypothetical protein